MKKVLITALFTGAIAVSGYAFTDTSIDRLIKEVKEPITIEKIRSITIPSSVYGEVSDDTKSSRVIKPVKESLKRQNQGKGIKSLKEVEKGLFQRNVQIAGSITLTQALSILLNEGYNIVLEEEINDKNLLLVINTNRVSDFVNKVCKASDLWCDLDIDKKEVVIRKTKRFIIDLSPEGKVTFTIGGGAGTSGATGGATGAGQATASTGGAVNSSQSTSYKVQNLNGEEVLEILKTSLKVDFIPSETGFLMAELTPSQWERVKDYFEEREKRKEIIKVEISLLRVDLSDKFQWGIDWAGFTKVLTRGADRISYGVTSNLIPDTEDRAFIALKDKDVQKGIFTALSTYGDVHKVDSWYYQMSTGTPVVFRNYQLVRYFTVGAVQNNNTTETTVEVNEDEVGFRGVLSVFRKKNGYYIDGFIDLSAITGFIEANVGDGVLKAPQLEGKSFRISTQITSLNQTLVIGGFRVRGFETTEKGVPLLSKIPVLGYLFKGKDDLKTNSEFVVFITLKPAKEGKARKEKEDTYRKINNELDTIERQIKGEKEGEV